MKKVKVYVEGGARGKNKNPVANIELRRGFSKFVEKLGVSPTARPEFVACGSRSQTWDLAWNNFVSRNEQEIIVLLVDSEDLTSYQPQEAWKHLKERDADRWTSLEERHSGYVFLMVIAMETWLIADQEALSQFFGRDFRPNKLPVWPNLESVEKDKIFGALEAATSGKFAKGESSFQLVAELDPLIVAGKCPHAKYFCDRMKLICSGG